MTDWTVEVTTTAVTSDEGWLPLRRVLDTVPGTILLEDAEEPTLIFPVTADSPMKAGMFVDGVAKLLDLTLLNGKIYAAPVIDFDIQDSEAKPVTEVVARVSQWVRGIEPPVGRVDAEGRLCDA